MAAVLRLKDRLQRGESFFGIFPLFAEALSGESVLATVGGHIAVSEFFGRAHTRALVARIPHIGNKYLVSYLASRFGKVERRRILLHHYDFAERHLIGSLYDVLFQSSPVLWRDGDSLSSSTISLAVSDHHQEGDLSLLFKFGGELIFVVSFSVVEGPLVGSGDQAVLLVGRVQGAPNKLSEIRASTKACRDISPAHLLIAALQAVADSLRIATIAGVSNSQQLVKGSSARAAFHFNYDDFWESLLAAPTPLGFYVMPVPLLQKPLAAIAITHRRRTRRKREYKEMLTETVKTNFVSTFLKA